jgi:hypothetical protein
MAKKDKDNNWIFWILLLAILVWGGTHGWFKSISTQTIIETPPNPNPNPNPIQPPVTPSSVCIDTDGGINWATWGWCNDTTTMASYPDACSATTQAVEYYCQDSLCKYTTKNCAVYETCISGICRPMPCLSIPNPSSQADCEQGVCEYTGMGCYFSPATLSIPAHCICGV